MIMLPTPVEKATRRLADIDAQFAAIEAERTPDLEFERHFALGEELEKLRRMRVSAVAALDTAKELQAKADAEAAKADAAAQLERYSREAKREAPSRLNKIAKLQGALAPELAWLKSHVDRADEMNALAKRFGLPAVLDGETSHRKTPDRTIPPQFEEQTVWEDGDGNRPYQFRQLPTGELVPSVNGYMKKRVKVQVRGEQFTPGQIPGGRLCSNIRLMGLKGEPLFIPR